MVETLSDHLSAEREQIAACLRILGTLFHSSPEDPALKPFFALIDQAELRNEWPFGDDRQLADIQRQLLENCDPSAREAAWQELFIGPHHFEAPPWGSVYLDKDNVIFGDSTLLLRSFLAEQGIAIDTGLNEPDDHIGLLLWVASGFVLEGKDDALIELLRVHLLPWSGRYIERLIEHAPHPFYRGLGNLAGMTLDALQQLFAIEPVQKQLYL